MANKTPLFSVSNKHVADSGTPPYFDGDVDGRYIGYFQNEYGEQAVFVYDHADQIGTLWMGDAGWEQSSRVVDGVAQDFLLGDAEALWLQACWLAATAGAESEK